MSLPIASQDQINKMHAIAEEKMKKDGINNISSEPEENTVLHPVLMTHPEPIYEEVQEEPTMQDNIEEEPQDIHENQQPFSYNTKENNIKSLRERAEKAEREREEAIKYIMSMQQGKQPIQIQPDIEIEDDPFSQLGLDDESLVEGKHLKELVKEIKNLRSTVKNYEKQSQKNAHETLEVKLQTQFPDFNKVVTNENLVQLREINPDLADAILANKDQYKQAKLAYDMVKQLGIYKEDVFVQDRITAQKNHSKPRPLSSISPTQSDNPMSKVNAFANAPLTKDLKDQHYQEMLQAMKGR